MLKTLLIIMISFLAVSCGPHYVDYFPYHDDGTPKPQVALLPVTDVSKVHMPWNVADELTQTLRYEIMNTGELFLFSKEEVQCGLTGVQGDWFENDQAFAKAFCDADFVAMVELIAQETTPCNKEGVEKLTLRARIKVVDIRCRNPRVALQEIVSRDYLVCLQQGLCANPEPFHATSVGKAHRDFTANIACRLENVILSSY